MNSQVKIAVSTVNDGSMKRNGGDVDQIDNNRRKFLVRHETTLEDTTLVQLDYNSDDFCRYNVVDELAKGEGMTRDGRIADGLATKTPGVTLFLPLADCIGVVLYDPEHEALMVTHLGRHNLQQHGGEKSVEFMKEQFGTDPAKLEIWFSPSAGGENYPLFAFENKSLAEVASEQLLRAGVVKDHIELSSIDTTKDTEYFSHSEFLKGNRPIDGRFTMAATLVP